MKKYLIIGGTGSGKTHFTFSKCLENGGRTLYLSPTALLTYEAFQKYGTVKDSLKAKGIIYNKNSKNNHFGIFANPNLDFLEKINEYKNIIIDECHWAFGQFEGHNLTINYILRNFKNNLFFVTATQNFPPTKDFEIINLESKFSFRKKEIAYDYALERAYDGVKTLVIAHTVGECNSFRSENLKLNLAMVNRTKTELEILQNLEKFKNNETMCLVGTNILAQGINLDCENLIIIDRWHNADDELFLQKIGRLGRPFLSNENVDLTFTLIGKTEADKQNLINKYNKFKPKKTVLKNIENYLNEKDDYSEEEITAKDKKEILKILLKNKS